MSFIEVIYEYRAAYSSGLLTTLKLCGIAWFIGLSGGAVLVLATEWLDKIIRIPMTLLSRTSEAIPILVLLFWLHYPVQASLGIVIDPFITTALLLSALNTLAVYGILDRALSQVPGDLTEIATICGVSRHETFLRIKLPLGLRYASSSLCTAQVNILQLSIFGGLIAVEELFRISQRINAQIYQPVAVYTVLALFFLSVCLPLNVLARHLMRKLDD